MEKPTDPENIQLIAVLRVLDASQDEVASMLQLGNPPIWLYGPKSYSRVHFYKNPGLTMNCQTLYHGTRKFPGNERLVVKRFEEILTKKR